MNQAIRILLVVQHFKNSNLRYKIAYRRIIYNGYNIQNGDELDQAIFNHFEEKQPITLRWEVTGVDTKNLNVTQGLKTFTGKIIPMLISPRLDDLNSFELENLYANSATFSMENKIVNLFYPSILAETHSNFVLLPTEVRVKINYQTYNEMIQTILLFQ